MAGSETDRNYLRTLGMRLDKLLSAVGLSPADLADHLGYQSADQVFKAIRGETSIRIDKLHLLSKIKTPDGKKCCNLHWFLTGDGPPLLDASAKDDRQVADSQEQEVGQYIAKKMGHRRALLLAKAIRR